MFGELVGVWVLGAWQASGRPLPVTLAEIGPGRGTLMQDLLRTIGKLDPGLALAADIAMVETSPRLAGVQKATLGERAGRVVWHETIASLPEQPLVIIANELFDALPIRQYVRTGGRWLERAIGLDQAGELRFVAGPGAPDPSLLPPDAATAPDGAVVELAPARTALMDAIAMRIASHGGAGLFIDYGHLRSAVGDTLQAIRAHRYEDVLDNPGEADLTAHVDFAHLAASRRTARPSRASVDARRFPARHGPARARRRARRRGRCRRRANACRARPSVLPAPTQWERCSRSWRLLRPGFACRLSRRPPDPAPVDLHPCPAALSRPDKEGRNDGRAARLDEPAPGNHKAAHVRWQPAGPGPFAGARAIETGRHPARLFHPGRRRFGRHLRRPQHRNGIA